MSSSTSTDSRLPLPAVDPRPSYLKVFLTFARNSLVRHMTFRANFLFEAATALVWMLMNLGFYLLIFKYTPSLGAGTGWGKYEFFIFLSTTLLVSSVVQALFMPNADEFGELIRSGGLDFALLKPIDTQFLVSMQKIDWSVMSNFVFAIVLLAYSLAQLDFRPGLLQWTLYPIYLLCGVAILYSLMISLAALSVWMGRNQSLYDFWFYITTFSRYPMEIYDGSFGRPLRWVFSFVVPILIVVNVPAALLAKPLSAQNWPLALYAVVAAVACLAGSRWLFRRALESYRSASS